MWALVLGPEPQRPRPVRPRGGQGCESREHSQKQVQKRSQPRKHSAPQRKLKAAPVPDGSESETPMIPKRPMTEHSKRALKLLGLTPRNIRLQTQQEFALERKLNGCSPPKVEKGPKSQSSPAVNAPDATDAATNTKPTKVNITEEVKVRYRVYKDHVAENAKSFQEMRKRLLKEKRKKNRSGDVADESALIQAMFRHSSSPETPSRQVQEIVDPCEIPAWLDIDGDGQISNTEMSVLLEEKARIKRMQEKQNRLLQNQQMRIERELAIAKKIVRKEENTTRHFINIAKQRRRDRNKKLEKEEKKESLRRERYKENQERRAELVKEVTAIELKHARDVEERNRHKAHKSHLAQRAHFHKQQKRLEKIAQREKLLRKQIIEKERHEQKMHEDRAAAIRNLQEAKRIKLAARNALGRDKSKAIKEERQQQIQARAVGMAVKMEKAARLARLRRHEKARAMHNANTKDTKHRHSVNLRRLKALEANHAKRISELELETKRANVQLEKVHAKSEHDQTLMRVHNDELRRVRQEKIKQSRRKEANRKRELQERIANKNEKHKRLVDAKQGIMDLRRKAAIALAAEKAKRDAQLHTLADKLPEHPQDYLSPRSTKHDYDEGKNPMYCRYSGCYKRRSGMGVHKMLCVQHSKLAHRSGELRMKMTSTTALLTNKFVGKMKRVLKKKKQEAVL